MTAELPKHELLLKLLKMTGSTNDAEALVAIRKANALLATAGWDWDRLLAGKITVVGDPFGNLQRPAQQAAPDFSRASQPRSPARAPAQPAFTAAGAQTGRMSAGPAQAKSKPWPPQPRRGKINYDDIFNDAQTFGRVNS